jgi:hypothetical protein
MKAVGRAIGDAFGFLWRLLKAFGKIIWGFMVIFSFVVNLVLLAVVAILGVYIFNIKNDVADPLLKGLHSSFVGLDQATIDWTIPVRDSVVAQFTLPLETDTTVVLTDDVPLTVSADISGPVSIFNATVALTLPEGTILPVALDLDVPVDEVIPVNLDVRAVIPLEETQLHDPFDNLRYTFEPIILALDNLPNDFPSAISFGNLVLFGQPPNLFDMDGSQYLESPWPGFSRTAGLGYELSGESQALNTPGDSPEALFGAQAAGGNAPNVIDTGIVALGGIPALDQFVRPDLYANGQSPEDINAEITAELDSFGIPSSSYIGVGDDAATLPTPPPSNVGDSADSGTGDAIGGPTDSSGNGEGGDVLIPGTPQPAFPVDGGS